MYYNSTLSSKERWNSVNIIIADPAKNITVFVLDTVEGSAKRAELTREILADSSIKAEQVGFVVPPALTAAVPGAGPDVTLWRLEMAGGEFCGNAARAFGLYVARQQGFKGKAKLLVSVSGAARPVAVEVDVKNNRAAAEMPKPLIVDTLDFRGCSLPVLVFEGITHVIAAEPRKLEAKKETFFAIKEALEKKFTSSAGALAGAIGVLFYDTASRFMRPAVYVRSVDSLVFESSCGSGSAAVGAWLSRELEDGAAQYSLRQSGGVIETEVIKKAGNIIRITIGGEVSLGEAVEFTVDTEG